MKEIKLYKFHRRKYGTEQRYDALDFDTIKPGILQFPIHRKSFYRLILVEEGDTIINVNGVRQTVGPNTVIDITELNVSQISHTLGFESVNYFIRFFKKQTGLTPAEFRNKVL